MNNLEIKKRIEQQRRKQNLSQSDVADLLSISQTAYHKIEKGDTILVSERIPQLATILHISEEELIFGKEFNTVREQNDLVIAERDSRIAELEEIIKDKNRIIHLLGEKLERM